jgi:hypothetical protein
MARRPCIRAEVPADALPCAASFIARRALHRARAVDAHLELVEVTRPILARSHRGPGPGKTRCSLCGARGHNAGSCARREEVAARRRELVDAALARLSEKGGAG